MPRSGHRPRRFYNGLTDCLPKGIADISNLGMVCEVFEPYQLSQPTLPRSLIVKYFSTSSHM